MVTQVPGPDASWTPPWGDILSMSHQAEALAKTQDTLEGRRLSTGPATPQGSLRGGRGSDLGEGSLNKFALTANPGRIAVCCLLRGPSVKKKKKNLLSVIIAWTKAGIIYSAISQETAGNN